MHFKYAISISILLLIIAESAIAMQKKENVALRISAEGSPVKKPKKMGKSGFSPKKGKEIALGLQSPYKKILRPKANFAGSNAVIIDGSTKDFSSGMFVYAGLFNVYGSFKVDADDLDWDEFAQEFTQEFLEKTALITTPPTNFNADMFEELLVELSHLVHNNIKSFYDGLTYSDPEQTGPVCRHYAAYVAVLFSKIMPLVAPTSWSAHVQVESARRVKHGPSLGSGHAWNVVTVQAGEETHRWHLDALNYSFVKLEDAKSMKNATLYRFHKINKIRNMALKDDEFNRFWVQHSINKYITADEENNPCNPKNNDKLCIMLANILAQKSYANKLTKRTSVIKENGAELADVRRRLF